MFVPSTQPPSAARTTRACEAPSGDPFLQEDGAGGSPLKAEGPHLWWTM